MVNHWLPVLAGLVAALMAALVLWPLRHHGRRGFVVGVFALGVAGACLYLLVGDPRAAQVQPTPSVATLRDGVQALQDALKRDPQRADGWALLGRSQAELGNASAAATPSRRPPNWHRMIRACWWKPRRRARRLMPASSSMTPR